MLITPNFHFTGECEQAIRFYETAFGAVTKTLLRYSDADPRDVDANANTTDSLVYHAEMWIGDQRIFLCDTTENEAPKGNSMSLVVTFDDADSVKRAYDVLSIGGRIIRPMVNTTYSSCFVSLVDRFGMRWELMTEQTER